MSKLINDNMLIEIAHMYYDEHMTQQQIAKKMNISRSLISKSLTKAREAGIVEVIVHSELIRPYKDIEDRLRKILGLNHVRICSSSNSIEAIAKEAGKLLSTKLSRCKYIVVSGGETVKYVADHFSPAINFPNVTFISANGGLGETHWATDANNICITFAQKCGAQHLQMYAPVTVDSAKAKEIFSKQLFIKSVLDKGKQADIALVGIGSSLQWSNLENTYLNDQKELYLINENVICGDICYNYFDKYGKWIDCTWNNQIIGLHLNDIRKIPEVICVAAGIQKTESIYVASQHRLITSLVTDLNTAKSLLSYYNKDLFD
ncbi:MAG: sugar-binding domain-containing protein [Lachnospiraceae bacterium]|nr:sugar-binding domain-containing protein [Lachnospiraceae bacterium]